MLLILISGCDLTTPIQKPKISSDHDFDTLVALVRTRIETLETGANRNEHDWNNVYQALIDDPVIEALASELAERYPDLNVDNAQLDLNDYISSRGLKLISSKTSGGEYYACLASVTAMGVIMMAGCSAAGPLAIPCGLAVAAWVGSESALCHMAVAPQ